MSDDPEKVVSKIRSERRNENLNIFTGVYWNVENRIIKIYTDAGRLVRPLYIVDNNETTNYKNTLSITNTS